MELLLVENAGIFQFSLWADKAYPNRSCMSRMSVTMETEPEETAA